MKPPDGTPSLSKAPTLVSESQYVLYTAPFEATKVPPQAIVAVGDAEPDVEVDVELSVDEGVEEAPLPFDGVAVVASLGDCLNPPTRPGLPGVKPGISMSLLR